MTVSDANRKIGINVSIPFNQIAKIDKRANDLGFSKRSNYIWTLIEKDLNNE